MYVRCSRCHESTWIRSLVPGMVEHTVACQDCGHEHDLSRSNELGATGKQQYETANAFAKTNGVDLPTAYSVLLGLMSLQEAREAKGLKKDKKRRNAAPDVTTVEETETPASVTARAAPPRRRWAASWSPGASHRKEKKEQKVTIHVERDMARERRKLTVGQGVLLLVLASLTIGLSGRHAYRMWRGLVQEGRTAQKNTAASSEAFESAQRKELAEAKKSQPRVPEALRAELLHDGEGQLIQVSGPNPMSVLEAYCEALSTTHEREPLELAQASPPSPDERYGIFRDFSRLESNRAIRISQDREVGRWIAGDGRGPIPTREAPPEPVTIRRAALKSAR